MSIINHMTIELFNVTHKCRCKTNADTSSLSDVIPMRIGRVFYVAHLRSDSISMQGLIRSSNLNPIKMVWDELNRRTALSFAC